MNEPREPDGSAVVFPEIKLPTVHMGIQFHPDVKDIIRTFHYDPENKKDEFVFRSNLMRCKVAAITGNRRTADSGSDCWKLADMIVNTSLRIIRHLKGEIAEQQAEIEAKDLKVRALRAEVVATASRRSVANADADETKVLNYVMDHPFCTRSTVKTNSFRIERRSLAYGVIDTLVEMGKLKDIGGKLHVNR